MRKTDPETGSYADRRDHYEEGQLELQLEESDRDEGIGG